MKIHVFGKIKKKSRTTKNIKKVFSEEKKIITEFNHELKLDLSKIQLITRL